MTPTNSRFVKNHKFCWTIYIVPVNIAINYIIVAVALKLF